MYLTSAGAPEEVLGGEGGSGMDSAAEAGSGEYGSGDPERRTTRPKPLPAPQTVVPTSHEPAPNSASATTTAKPTCTASDGVLHCYESGCSRECFSEVSAALLMLLIAGMSAHTFGNLLSGFGFPAITIFLFFGVVLGPYGTNVVTADDSKKLMWCADAAAVPPRACPPARPAHPAGFTPPPLFTPKPDSSTALHRLCSHHVLHWLFNPAPLFTPEPLFTSAPLHTSSASSDASLHASRGLFMVFVELTFSVHHRRLWPRPKINDASLHTAALHSSASLQRNKSPTLAHAQTILYTSN